MTIDLPRDCPECGAMASVRDGVCDLCLFDVDEYSPVAPQPRYAGSRSERRRPSGGDDGLWFSEAWFS